MTTDQTKDEIIAQVREHDAARRKVTARELARMVRAESYVMAMERCSWNGSRAARISGFDPKTSSRWVKLWYETVGKLR